MQQIGFACSAHHCTCSGQHVAIATHCPYSCCGAGRDSSGAGGWTLTPTPPVWTQTPTEDSSCFADPENFDCACHAKKQRQCAYVPSSQCISCSTSHQLSCRKEEFRKQLQRAHQAKVVSVTQCEHFFVCTHSNTCQRYAQRCCARTYGWYVHKCVQTKKYMQLNMTQPMQHSTYNACAHTFAGTRPSTAK